MQIADAVQTLTSVEWGRVTVKNIAIVREIWFVAMKTAGISTLSGLRSLIVVLCKLMVRHLS